MSQGFTSVCLVTRTANLVGLCEHIEIKQNQNQYRFYWLSKCVHIGVNYMGDADAITTTFTKAPFIFKSLIFLYKKRRSK